MFDFPDTPTINQSVTAPSGGTFIWDGVKWRPNTSPAQAPSQFLPLAGGTMTGPLNWTATSTPTSRSAQDRAADWINVKDYGAVLDGVTNDWNAFNAAYVAAPPNATIFVPRGGVSVTGPAFTGTGPVLWQVDGDSYGTSANNPVSALGDGDVLETFIGRKSFRKYVTNSPNLFATVDITLANSSSATGGVASNLYVETSTAANTGMFTWGINAVLDDHSMGGDNTQDVGIASSVWKHGAATTWQYFGQTIDDTGLGYPDSTGSIVIAEYDIQANGPEPPTTGYTPAFGDRTGIEIDLSTPYQPPAWQASHAYAVGDAIQPSPANGFTYICTVGGTSAASHPTWPTAAGTVTDGGVTWRYGATIAFQVSRAMAIGCADANSSYGAGILVQTARFYDAILEFSGATLVDGGVKDAAIRLHADHPIDFSGNLTDAGQNLHTLRYISTGTPRLSYMVGAAERLTLPDAKPIVTGSRGGNAALASLLTALAAANLITDSTTA